MAHASNFTPYEATISTATTLTLDRPAREIEIINDSGTAYLQFKFNESESYGKLLPLEVISIATRANTIYLNPEASLSYRIRVWS